MRNKFYFCDSGIRLFIVNVDFQSGCFSVSHRKKIVLSAPVSPSSVTRKKLNLWINALIHKTSLYCLSANLLVIILRICRNNINRCLPLILMERFDCDCSTSITVILLFIAKSGVQLTGNDYDVCISRVHRVFKSAFFIRRDGKCSNSFYTEIIIPCDFDIQHSLSALA